MAPANRAAARGAAATTTTTKAAPPSSSSRRAGAAKPPAAKAANGGGGGARRSPAASAAASAGKAPAASAAAAAAANGGGGGGQKRGAKATPSSSGARKKPSSSTTATPAPALDSGAEHPLVRAVDDAAAYVRARTPKNLPPPQVALVLGSGLGGLADDLDASAPRAEIRYADVPGFHASAVQGHPGRLLLGTLGGVSVLVLQGRFHYYEGHGMESVALPVRLARRLGCHTVVLTNAAGGLDPTHLPGDLMLITDHLNLVGANPLRGANPPGLFGGPRFLDQSRPYDRRCGDALQRAAAALGQPPLREGVYAGVSGPTYETPAETRMLRLLGGDAVGMSTVPEAIAAAHSGLRVVGVSNITNAACSSADQPVSHDEVMAMSAAGADKLRALLRAAVPEMAVGGKSGPAEAAAANGGGSGGAK